MKVLVAVADERFGDALVSFINNYEWPAHTEFMVLNVIEPVGLEHLSDVSFAPFLQSVEEETKKEADSLVRRVALRIRDKFKSPFVEEEVAKGKAKDKILETAEEWNADLIVVGSHGRSGLDLFLLGSVSNAVVTLAKCSVIVIKLPKPASQEGSDQKPETRKSQMILRS